MRIFSPILSFLNSKVTAYTNAAVSPSVCGRPPKGMLCFAARGLARLSGFSKRPSARPAPAGPLLCCIRSFASPLVNVYIFTLFLSFFQPASINSILLMFCPNRTILFSSPVHRGRRKGAPFRLPRYTGEGEKGPLFLNRTLCRGHFHLQPAALSKNCKNFVNVYNFRLFHRPYRPGDKADAFGPYAHFVKSFTLVPSSRVHGHTWRFSRRSGLASPRICATRIRPAVVPTHSSCWYTL